MPPFTWRQHVADLPGSGFSRTTVKDYGQTDWERNILWRKRRYFLVADVMRARTAEDYDFRALWRLIGATDLGAAHAAFRFLESVGCRWFFPAREWEVVPSRPTLTVGSLLGSGPSQSKKP